MYSVIEPFGIDKGMNTVVEESIAPIYIRQYHFNQGRKVNVVRKNLGDIEQSKLYDLEDGYGIKWEVKYDRIFSTTGNVYIELQALESSRADKYLIFAGPALVIAKSALYELCRANMNRVKAGGDEHRSMGIPFTDTELIAIAEDVICL